MGGQHPQKVDAGLLRRESAAGLILGGAQIGSSYGICNRSGPQDGESLQSMFSIARDAGIRCIDTAPAYGISEELIGRYIDEEPEF
ncbi:MAG: aldo/keto reductase, partial [Planctomycetota bacterium]